MARLNYNQFNNNKLQKAGQQRCPNDWNDIGEMLFFQEGFIVQ